MAITLPIMPAGGVTGQVMCELIADVMEDLTGVRPDPRALWRLSPSGEVWPVVALYQWCVRIAEARDG